MIVTENDWLTSTDPQAMLEYLYPDPENGLTAMALPLEVYTRKSVATDRKLRLWAAACNKSIQGSVNGTMRLWTRGESDREGIQPEMSAIRTWASKVGPPERKRQLALRANFLRDIFDNPWKPVSLRWVRLRWNEDQLNHVTYAHHGMHLSPTEYLDPVNWLIPQAVSIAHYCYEEDDYEGLPILADVLEEAGCEELSLLEHLRSLKKCGKCLGTGNGGDNYMEGDKKITCHECKNSGVVSLQVPHVRGCWAVDLLLGKS